LGDQVPEREKRKRLLRLREAQRAASAHARQGRIGETVRVLVEDRRALRKSDPLRGALGVGHAMMGRSMGEAPGVDGGIYFTEEAAIGSFVNVRLEGTTAFDFHGTALAEGEAYG
jgi:tRNA A37 methylthiotransferase MiaB